MDSKCSSCRLSRPVCYCFSCHLQFCRSCQQIHTTSKVGHIFELPDFRFNEYCEEHHYRLSEYCKKCDRLICNDCLPSHNGHRKLSLYTLQQELEKQIIEERDRIEINIKNADEAIKEREEQFRQMKSTVNDILSDFRYMSVQRPLGKQVNRLAKDVSNLVESFDSKEIAAIKEQMTTLKLVLYINEQTNKFLNRTLYLYCVDNLRYILKANHYKAVIEQYVRFPPMPDLSKIHNLEVHYDQPTEEELLQTVFRIYIGQYPLIQFNRNKANYLPLETQVPHEESRRINKSNSAIDEELRQKNTEIQQLKERLRKIEDMKRNQSGQLSTKDFEIEKLKKECKELKERAKSKVEPITATTTEPWIRQNMELEQLKTRLEQTEKRAKEEIETLKEEHKVNLSSRNDEVDRLQTELQTQKKRLYQIEKKEMEEMEVLNQQHKQISKTLEEIEIWKKGSQTFKEKYENEVKAHRETQKFLEKEKKGVEELKNRLSQVAGAKLVSGNASIADLGDKFRPTKIAEMYSEIYDNDWTNAVDALTHLGRSGFEEDDVIQHLFFVLQGCHRACSKIAENQMHELIEKLFCPLPNEKVTQMFEAHVAEIKQIRDSRKGASMDVSYYMCEVIKEDATFVKYLDGLKGAEKSLLREILEQDFFQKCCQICWLMVVQDPPMSIDEPLKEGTRFNKDLYREYTKSGTKVLFSIWPALFLHENGPLLVKGVAQAYK